MSTLVTPDARFHSSFLEALAEFGDTPRDGSGQHAFDFSELDDPGRFADLLVWLRGNARSNVARLDGSVPCTYLWITEGDRFIGFLAIRHELNEILLDRGGHIGYSVRPSERRRGHARSALRQALPVAAELGIDAVLVTCDEDNLGSRAVIEGNNGVYEDSRSGRRRYWIDTH